MVVYDVAVMALQLVEQAVMAVEVANLKNFVVVVVGSNDVVRMILHEGVLQWLDLFDDVCVMME